MSDDAKAEALLEGPRGRRVCLEFARPVHSMEGRALEGPDPLAEALFWAAHERDEGSTTLVMYSRISDGDDRADTSIPSAPPIEEVARLLEASPLAEPTDAVLMECLSGAVNSAMYWQRPDGDDVLAAEPELHLPLLRIARVIVGSTAAAWWTDPVEGGDQWAVAFESAAYDDAVTVDGLPDTAVVAARDALDTWQTAMLRDEAEWRGHPIAPGVPMSGSWWSTPPSRLLRTTGSLGERGPLGLHYVEDGFGWRAADVRRVDVADSARVFEITSADDWAGLCRRYPLEVTASRRHDWARATGRDGAWVIPDWALVADEYDAVHLTVAGYLNAAGQAIPIEEGTASVLAGWDPDQTVWLRDGVAVPAPEAQPWSCDEEGEWRRA